MSDMMESGEPSPEDNAVQYEFASRLREAIEQFGNSLSDERRQSIWFERTLSDEPDSLRQLGEVWDVSKERIRQIEVEIRDDFRIFLTDFMGGQEELEMAYRV